MLRTTTQAAMAAVGAVPDFIYTFDIDGRFLYANDALCLLLQRTPAEMIGMNFHDLGYPEPLASTLQAQIRQVVETKVTVRAETPFKGPSREGFYEYIFVPILNENGEVGAVAGTTRDLTERKIAEDALRESRSHAEFLVSELRVAQEKLQALFEQAPAFIATLSGPQFVFDFANEDYFKLVGRRDIIGLSVREAFPEIAAQGYIDLLQHVFATGEPFNGRGMTVSFEVDGGGQRVHHINFIYQAIRNAGGEPTGILVHGVDVTDEVKAMREVERLNAELERRVAERTLQLEIANRDLEGFTYSVAHDLRAPLRAIAATSRILIHDHSAQLSPEAAYELERQDAAAIKLAGLVDELLKISRLTRHQIRKSTVSVSQMADGIASELAAREGFPFCSFKIARGMSAVADPTSLRLLLLNLMENACKFSPSGAQAEVGCSIVAGETVFWVRDQGIGFEMKYAHKLFRPFERLVNDRDFPGTGIGLSNAKRTVEMHGGRIWAESELGKGATFYFVLEPCRQPDVPNAHSIDGLLI